MVELATQDDITLYCALTNSNVKFIGSLKEFVEMVNRKTGVAIADIEKDLCYSKLMKKFAEISNKTFISIQDFVVKATQMRFDGFKDPMKFQLVVFAC